MVTAEDEARSPSQRGASLQHPDKDGPRSQAAQPLRGETGEGKGWGLQLAQPSAVQ